MEYKKKALNRKINKMELADANSELLLKTINEQMMHEASEHKIMMKHLKERAGTEKRKKKKYRLRGRSSETAKAHRG
eukprot:TRINITY_DN2994_c0_g1_i1.p2 TRINITY_DN2994_c0_g1~~TRINITY_DN2994_c0_g1_i1.p2  ORF type:complete len:77 (-),score=49.93 TRINITY_DN2994_c0_g1_i1:2-232(-)